MEIWAQMGQETSLRQQGEIAEAGKEEKAEVKSLRKARRLEVRTSVSIPEIGAPGLQQGGFLYFSVYHVSGWLEATADAFDEAHAMSDIGGVLRACAAEVREARIA